MSFTPGDLGYDLLPPDPGVVAPELQLDAAVAPLAELGPPPLAPLGRGWAFDFTTSQFVRNGSAPAAVYDIDNLRVWIEKTLRTAKFAHAIYSDTYGTDEPFGLVGQPASAEAIGEYEQHVTDALMVHDRIVSVEDFFYSKQPSDDGLFVTFSVVLDGYPQERVPVGWIPVGSG